MRFIELKFIVGNLILCEEFQYANICKISSTYADPYSNLKEVSNVNYEIDRPNYLSKQGSEIFYARHLIYYYT